MSCWPLRPGRHGLLETGTGGIELTAMPRHHTERSLDDRTQPRPPPFEARAQCLEHLDHPMQICACEVVDHQGNHRRDQFVTQVGPAQLQAPLEVADGGAGLIALQGRGEESPLQPHRGMPATIRPVLVEASTPSCSDRNVTPRSVSSCRVLTMPRMFAAQPVEPPDDWGVALPVDIAGTRRSPGGRTRSRRAPVLRRRAVGHRR